MHFYKKKNIVAARAPASYDVFARFLPEKKGTINSHLQTFLLHSLKKN